jgi:hypothetical protein
MSHLPGTGTVRLPSASVTCVLLAVLVLLCPGCTTTSFTKRGATAEVYARDEDVCESQARWLYLFYSESRYRDCMSQRGYVIR